MDRKQRRELEELKHEKDVFALVATNNASWSEILQAILYYDDNISGKNSINPHILLSIKHLQPLEHYGIDYNHIDIYGNHFLQHVLISREEQKNFSGFGQEARDYIISHTKNLYHINNMGENILFPLLSYNNNGLNGEEFFRFIKQYPTDLHIINKRGQNLLNKAILLDVQFDIKMFLIEQQLSMTHLDANDFTILHQAFSLSYNKENSEVMRILFRHVDPTIKNKFDIDLVHFWLDNLALEDEHKHVRRKAQSWLREMIHYMAIDNVLPEAKENIYQIMEQEQLRFETVSEQFHPLLLTLRQERLNSTLRKKPEQKYKIKI